MIIYLKAQAGDISNLRLRLLGTFPVSISKEIKYIGNLFAHTGKISLLLSKNLLLYFCRCCGII